MAGAWCGFLFSLKVCCYVQGNLIGLLRKTAFSSRSNGVNNS